MTNDGQDLEAALGPMAANLDRMESEVIAAVRRRLGKLALCCVRLRSRIGTLPANWQGFLTSEIEALEDGIAAQHDERADLALKDDGLGRALGDLVHDKRAAQDQTAAAQGELRDAREALRLSQIRVMELEGQMRRLAEHKQHHEHIRERVWASTGGKCLYCSVDLVKEQGLPNSFEVDHLVPKNAGGPDHLANFVPSCAKCNGEKSDRPFLEFVMNERKRAVLRVVGGSESTP